MNAGPKYEYHWCDGVKIKKPIKVQNLPLVSLQVSAPEYVDYLMTWIQSQLDDETMFPSKLGVPFPKHFQTILRQIFKRLFRVYAHVYYHHFQVIMMLGQEAHLNTSFKHFIYFVKEFGLVEVKELVPLQELIEGLMEN